jgi:hypothetical protein
VAEPRPVDGDERTFPEWVWKKLLPEEHFVNVEVRADGLRDLDVEGVQAEADRLSSMVGDLGLEYSSSYMRPGLSAGVGAIAAGDPTQAFTVAAQLRDVTQKWRPDCCLCNIFITPVEYTDDEAEELITERWGIPARVLLTEVESHGPDAPLPPDFDHLIRA